MKARAKRNSQIPGPLPMFLEDTCERNGCRAIALWAPKLLIPVTGLGDAAPYEMLFGIELCRAHFYALRPQGYLDAQLRGLVADVMKRAGVAPDFARAHFTPVHVTSTEYRRFARTLAGERRIYVSER